MKSRFSSHEEKALAALMEADRQKGALVDLMAREPDLTLAYIKRQQDRFTALENYAKEWADNNIVVETRVVTEGQIKKEILCLVIG